MNDLERDLRGVFHDDARRVPTPARAPEGLRRSARRRQAVFGGVVALAGLAVVAGVVAGATTLLSGQTGPEPAAEGPKTTGTMNGITITYPQAWHLIDPDRAGLNGPPTTGESPLPRIVLALAPTEAPETFGCPGPATEGDVAPLLMTIQEMPLALRGPTSAPWPVELQSMSVDASESRCYPDWEFLSAGWTASGRSFEARVGISPGASGEERDALFAAFGSMTFEPSGDDAPAVELARGTAGGEEWQLFASRTKGGLSLELAGETTGAGTAGLDGSSTEFQTSEIVFGSGPDGERVIFGAVPLGVVRVEAFPGGTGSAISTEVLDVPDEIDAKLSAFVLVLEADLGGQPEGVELDAYDANGRVILTGVGDAGGVEAPTPVLPTEVLPEHGGTYWGLYLAVGPSADDPDIERWARRMEQIGYSPSGGDLACDDGAAAELGVSPGWSGVAVYFGSLEDARVANETIATSLRSGEPVGIARVTTYCLD